MIFALISGMVSFILDLQEDLILAFGAGVFGFFFGLLLEMLIWRVWLNKGI